jgi:hypothetical protein
MSVELMVGAKGSLYCDDCLYCVGFGFLGGIDSDFWWVAVATCYCPDHRFLAFSLIPAVQVLNSTQEGH